MSNEKMRIIKLIEDKVITAEEGIKLLESLKTEVKTSEDVVVEKETSKVVFEKSPQVDDLDHIEIDEDYVEEKETPKTNNDDVMEKVQDKINKAAEKIQKAFEKGGKNEEAIENFGDQIGKTIGDVSKLIEGKFGEMKKEMKDSKNREHISEEYTLAFETLKDINVSLISGDVDVQTEDREDIMILATGYELPEGEPLLLIEERNGNLNVEINKMSDKGLFSQFVNMTKEVDVKLFLPEAYKGGINLKNVSGDFDIRNVDLDFIKLTTVSGDIDANEVFANGVVITTTSGDIEIAELKGDVKVTTVSGDVDVNMTELSDALEIKSVSGDVEVVLSEKAQFALSMKSVSGDLECAFTLDELKVSKKSKVEAIIGLGDKSVKIATTSGDIEIAKR